MTLWCLAVLAVLTGSWTTCSASSSPEVNDENSLDAVFIQKGLVISPDSLATFKDAQASDTDCELSFSKESVASVMPPNMSFIAYNPTMVFQKQANQLIGLSRVSLLYADGGKCDIKRGTKSDPEWAAALRWCRYTFGMGRLRDLLVEFKVSLEAPCTAHMLRIVGEGEDPRLFHSAEGSILATYEHFEAWTVDGFPLDESLGMRPLYMYEWGSSVERNTPSSARLIFTGAQTSATDFLGSAKEKNSSALTSDMWMAVDSLLNSCAIFDLPDYTACSTNDGYEDFSFVNYTRAPIACNMKINKAVEDKKLELRKPALSLLQGAFTFGVGFFSDKNWSPFTVDGVDYMATWLEPFTVCRFDGAPKERFHRHLRDANGTFEMFLTGNRSVGFQSRKTATPGCGQCTQVSSHNNDVAVRRMVSMAMEDTRQKLETRDLLTQNMILRPKNGNDGVHLNGVPMLRLHNFAGHVDVFLGIAHFITEAWWTALTSTNANFTTSTALSYTHFFYLASAAPPFELLDVSSKPVPLVNGVSPQGWFANCTSLHEDVHQQKKNRSNEYPCGLDISFVSGFEQIGQTMLISYGSGDASSRMLRMPLRNIESLFA